MLKQGRNSPIDEVLQIAIIYAVVNNLLAEIDVADIGEFEKTLFEYLTGSCPELISAIRESGVLSPESEAALRESVIHVKEKFLA